MHRLCRRGILALFFVAISACTQSTPTASHPDFTGLWQIADASLTVKPEDAPNVLTPLASQRRKDFADRYLDTLGDPGKFCLPHGMPWIMVSRARDYLIDIYQTADRVTLLFEGMDVHRLIRLDQTQIPESFSPSTNGYSLARWEGDTLVIETRELRPSNVVNPFQRSEQMQIVERWQLIDHPRFGRALQVELSVTDPVNYTGTARGYQLFVPAPAGSVLNAYGCSESLWDDQVNAYTSAHPQPAKPANQ